MYQRLQMYIVGLEGVSVREMKKNVKREAWFHSFKRVITWTGTPLQHPLHNVYS